MIAAEALTLPVITGQHCVEEARSFYVDAVQRDVAGEAAPYLQRLQAQPSASADDPEVPVI